MALIGNFTINGKSGRNYTFRYYTIDEDFKPNEGLYVLLAKHGIGSAIVDTAVCINETEDISLELKKEEIRKKMLAFSVSHVAFETDQDIGRRRDALEDIASAIVLKCK